MAMPKDYDGCNVREATLADHDEIVAIRDGIYDGLDYISALLKDLLTKHKGYVAVVDDKIVAFCLVHLVDNDQTMISRALRVHKDYEGKGITRHLKATIEKIYKEQGVVRKSLTFVDPELLFKLEEQKKLIVYNRFLQVFDGSFKEILMAINSMRTEKFLSCFVTKNTPESLLEIFESEDEKVVFPGKRLVYDWLPLRMFASNLSHIDTWACVRVSRKLSTDQRNKNCPLVSIGNVYACPSGIRANVDFFGKISSNEEILWHIKEQLNCQEKLPNMPNELLCSLICITDKSMTLANSLELILKPYGFNKRDFFAKFSACVEDIL